LTSPTPFGRQSFNSKSVPAGPDAAASVDIPPATAAATGSTLSPQDVTGAITTTLGGAGGRKGDTVPVPPSEKLPDAIGGPVLRVAALTGDPAAAYEIGLRFAEGRGVPSNLEEAAKWYDRAARAGVVPAIFRIGTFYEKGMGVKKDADIARRYYAQAADRGSAKAMHNLAVLDADGGGAAANYKSAAQWFRKAAERGVADSQFNLGILYARGIGVEQNLAESFKWFSLAAAQGDADAAHKRDDVAKRLDPQSLAAAKLAIQTFAAEPQPDDAVNVAAPPGGWDSAPSQANAPKPGAKQPPKRTAAR
jgi:localization factor PodJL